MSYQQPNPAIEGWMQPEELDWLYAYARSCQIIVEIGSWCGRSTHALLSGCPGKVYAVDTWKGSASQIENVHARAKTDDIHAEFMKNCGHFPNLVPMKMDSLEAVEHFDDNSIDMVFIDGDHEYKMFMRDVIAWKPKAKFLCGHDRREGGVAAVLHDLGIKTSNGPGSIWIADANGTLHKEATGPNEVTRDFRDVEVVLKPLTMNAEPNL